MPRHVVRIFRLSRGFKVGSCVFKRIQIIGSQQNDPDHLFEALRIAAARKVKVLTEAYGLDEAPKAYERVAQGKSRLRTVLVMN